MKIIHLITGTNFDPPDRYAAEVIIGMHRAGIDQLALMPRDAPIAEELRKADVATARIPSNGPVEWLRYRTHRIAAREKAQVVQAWSPQAARMLPANNRFNTVGWIAGAYEPKPFENCTQIVTVTRDLGAQITQQLEPVRQPRWIAAIADVVQVPAIDRTMFTTPREGKIVLGLTGFYPNKGTEDFLRACVHLPNDHYVWLPGTGPLRKAAEALVGELDLAARVRFIGDRINLFALLRTVNVCIVPGRTDPFAGVIPTAWCAACPVIGFQGPASATIIDHATGILVPKGDARQLAAQISHVIGNDTVRQKLIAQGYAEYNQYYTREAVIRSWTKVYAALGPMAIKAA